MKTLTINPTFRDLIPPLSDEERQMLERNLTVDGCINPIIVWGDTIVDGHNRYEICSRTWIQFQVVSKEFADADEAADWIERNQLGRRNLTPDIFKLILGRRYNRQKKAAHAGENQHTVGGDQNEPHLKTAERLAAEHHVSPATVKRAAKFAEAVDAEPSKAAAVMRGEKVEIPKKNDSAAFAERYEADHKPAADEVAAQKDDGAEDAVDETSMTLKTITPRTADGGTKTITCGRALAIYIKCMECLGWEGNPNKDCCSPTCPLFPWRGRTYKTLRGDKKAKK